MARLLLAATLLAHALLVALGGSGDFEGSGSGEMDCISPDPRPGRPGVDSQTTAEMEGQCHLACVEKVRKPCGARVVCARLFVVCAY